MSVTSVMIEILGMCSYLCLADRFENRSNGAARRYSGSSSASAASPSEATGFEAFAGCCRLRSEAAGAAREQLAQVAALAVPTAESSAPRGGACPATRYFLIFSSRFGPIPRTDSKSSTLLNAPYDFRIAKILSAVAGPIPGTSCNCTELAELISIGWAGGFFVAGNAAEASKRKHTIQQQNSNNARGTRILIARA